MGDVADAGGALSLALVREPAHDTVGLVGRHNVGDHAVAPAHAVVLELRHVGRGLRHVGEVRGRADAALGEAVIHDRHGIRVRPGVLAVGDLQAGLRPRAAFHRGGRRRSRQRGSEPRHLVAQLGDLLLGGDHRRGCAPAEGLLPLPRRPPRPLPSAGMCLLESLRQGLLRVDMLGTRRSASTINSMRRLLPCPAASCAASDRCRRADRRAPPPAQAPTGGPRARSPRTARRGRAGAQHRASPLRSNELRCTTNENDARRPGRPHDVAWDVAIYKLRLHYCRSILQLTF